MAERPMGALALYEAAFARIRRAALVSEDAYTVLFQSVLVQNTAWGQCGKDLRGHRRAAETRGHRGTFDGRTGSAHPPLRVLPGKGARHPGADGVVREIRL